MSYHWHNKTELITWLESHAPTRGAERALRSGGEITVLGAFNPLPESNSPGFIVTALSRAGHTYYMAVVVSVLKPPRTYLIDYIDWATYCGTNSENELYRGDVRSSAIHNKFNKVFERLGT